MRKRKTKGPSPQIIANESEFLIVVKPAGWITNEASTTTDQPVLQTWLKSSQDYPVSRSRELRSGIVHRLDKETSGVLIIAKTEKAFHSLQKQFKERSVKKVYTALAHGKVEPKKGEINVPVDRTPWNRRRFGVVPGGRQAFTSYEVDKYYSKDEKDYSLITLHPKTGRTHQIRVHLKHIGNPIVSDEFYAGRKTARDDRAWCPRLFLHASQITFTDPSSNKNVTFKADLPSDLTKALNNLSSLDR